MWESVGVFDSDGLIVPTRRARVGQGGRGGGVGLGGGGAEGHLGLPGWVWTCAG